MGFDMEIKSLYLIDKISSEAAANFGKKELLKTLNSLKLNLQFINHWQEIRQWEQSLCVITGLADDWLIRKLFSKNNIKLKNQPEGVIYQWCNVGDKNVLVIAGTDNRGLMYALLEMAAEIKSGGTQVLTSIESLLEFPDNSVRGLNRFIMGPIDDHWFYSNEFWNYYLSRLAKYRYNRFILVTGFDTGYMSPPYPYFVKVPDYPHVKVKGYNQNQRQKNLEQLKTIGELCHQYGLEFFFGSWQQTPWTGDQGIMISGLSQGEENLTPYCIQGLKTLLEKCPQIDGLQLRVNMESGIGTRENTAEDFWKKLIKAVSESETENNRKLILALRAKGITDSMINFAINLGLEIEVPTKYWCEHSGLPYHLSRMRQGELDNLDDLNRSRRYSYSDLLQKPYWYDIVYRLWNFGSSCILLWGDPDYAKRFSMSIKAGGGSGYEIAAPLSLKGGRASIQEKSWPLIIDKNFKYYQWEDERYWFWYLVFGRIGYSNNTDPEVWLREFRERFGKENAIHLEEAYSAASKVLPLITAFHMPVHPSLIYWTELSTGAALFVENNYNDRIHQEGKRTYINTEPGDPGLFYAIDEYVSDYLDGCVREKYTPLQVANWLQKIACSIEKSLSKIKNETTMNNQKEYKATKLDLLLLADLARYHFWKIKAAIKLNLYQRTENVSSLKSAYKAAQIAQSKWESLATSSDGVYYEDLIFGTGAGTGRRGHWKDRLSELNQDVRKLKELLNDKQEKTNEFSLEKSEINLKNNNVYQQLDPSFQDNIPEVHFAEKDLEILVKIGGVISPDHLTMHYRHMNQLEGSFKTLKMSKETEVFTGIISGDYLKPDWDIMIYFTTSIEDKPIIYPGLYHAEFPFPYFVVKIINPN